MQLGKLAISQVRRRQESEEWKIVVLQGENAVNNIKTRVVTEPVVEIRDARDLPVAGVESARKVLDPTLPANTLIERAGTLRP